MPEPLISVIVNTYNYGRFVEDAIDSALAQDYPADRMEILVVDDGSTDDTAERVKKYGDRIRYFYKENGDQCSAITFGAARSNGELLAFLDADDVWLPNKLSRIAQEFAKDPRVVMAYNRFVFWDPRDGSTWAFDEFTDVSGDVPSDRRKLLTYINAPTSSLVLHREAFQRLTNIPLDRAFSYDLYLAVAALFLGPVACVPEVLTKYRVHGQNRWAADKNGPDAQILQRRTTRLRAAIEVLRDWLGANASDARLEARTVLRRYQLFYENVLFGLNPPGRFRSFLYHARYNLTYGPIMTRADLAYKWIYAFVVLAAGRHAHHLEGVRTRVKRLTRRLQRQTSAEKAGETAEPIS